MYDGQGSGVSGYGTMQVGLLLGGHLGCLPAQSWREMQMLDSAAWSALPPCIQTAKHYAAVTLVTYKWGSFLAAV